MGYSMDTAGAVDEAVEWATASARRTLGTYVQMVERAQDGSYTADQFARDVALLTVGVQQDAARAFTTWSKLLTGLTK